MSTFVIPPDLAAARSAALNLLMAADFVFNYQREIEDWRYIRVIMSLCHSYINEKRLIEELRDELAASREATVSLRGYHATSAHLLTLVVAKRAYDIILEAAYPEEEFIVFYGEPPEVHHDACVKHLDEIRSSLEEEAPVEGQDHIRILIQKETALAAKARLQYQATIAPVQSTDISDSPDNQLKLSTSEIAKIVFEEKHCRENAASAARLIHKWMQERKFWFVKYGRKYEVSKSTLDILRMANLRQ